MTLASIAGIATIASAGFLVATIAIGATGGSIALGAIGIPSIGGLSLLGVLILAPLGLGLTALVGPVPLHQRATRVGLFVLALGLAALASSSVIGMTLTYDPLENWPSVITLLGGILGVLIGAVTTILAFLATRGTPRRLSLLFLGGLLLGIIGGNIAFNLLANGALRGYAGPLFLAAAGVLGLGVAAMVAAYAGIGWLAIRHARRSAEAPTG